MIKLDNKLKNVNNNHFPDPEKPVRKESNSILMLNQSSSNFEYDVFNSDSYVFKTNINGINNYNIFGVMDGQGPQGHFVSQFASKLIPFKIANHKEIQSLNDPKEIYKKLKYNEYEIINQIFLEIDIQLKKVYLDAT